MISTHRNQFGIDPNASSPQRIRRNFQRLSTMNVGSGTINTVVAPLNLSGGTLSINLDNITVQNSGGLLQVILSPFGGISPNVTGLGGAPGLAVTGFQQLSVDPAGPFLQPAVSWYNTTVGQSRTCLANDGTVSIIGSTMTGIYVYGTTQSVSCTTTPQTVPGGFTSTFPSGFLNLSSGRVLRYTVSGSLGVNASPSQVFTITLLLGSTVVGTVILPPVPTFTGSNAAFSLILLLQSGNNVTVFSGLLVNVAGQSVNIPLVSTAITLTGELAWTFQIKSASTSTPNDVAFFSSVIIECLF